jgi:hypothetical protein
MPLEVVEIIYQNYLQSATDHSPKGGDLDEWLGKNVLLIE